VRQREVSVKRQMDAWKLVFLVGMILILAAIAGVIAIGLKLPNNDTPRATFLVEVAKILTAGVIVGFLGGGLKQLLDNAAEKKQKLEAQLATKKALYKSLQDATHKALRDLRDPKYRVGSFDAILFHENRDFEALIEEWESFEPGPAGAVKSEYLALEDEFNKSGVLSDEFREKAKGELLAWSKQFSSWALR